MRQAGMLCLLVLLSAALLSAQRTNSDTSSSSQTQTPSSQNSSTVNPQSPTTPMGTEPSQSSPAPSANPSQQGTAPNTSDQNSARPPDMSGVQTVQPAPTGADQVPANTEMHAALDTPLSSKTSKGGDRFTSTVTDPVRGSNGAVIIPAGARVEGEVADTEQTNTIPALRGKMQLSLHFRDIVLPNGQTLPLSATLVSVNNTNGSRSARKADDGQVQSGTQGKDVAKDTGAGTDASGAGLVFGSPLKGMAVGALSGGGYVLSTKDKDINLPAQTGMVIRLDQPLSANGATITQR